MLKSKEITICTTNHGKIAEFQEIFTNLLELDSELALSLKKKGIDISIFKTLSDKGIKDFDVDETEDSYLGNASLKAIAGAKAVQGLALADDSGIEVFALDKAPGIYSGRYLRDPERGINGLLREMQDISDRKVRYVCALVLANAAGDILFQTERYWYGELAYEKHGEQGFGFDPIVYPDLESNPAEAYMQEDEVLSEYKVDKSKTVAELSSKEKNSYSHRFKAVKELLNFLKAY
jgi:XTP/dITP diphosphohydrolase